MTAAERAAWIERYANGPVLLEATFAKVPAEARQWRPGPGKWSAHEVIVHCADSEANAHLRIRYLVAEREPVIVGYDQDVWARDLDYHRHPVELAFATIRAVRANTVPLLRRLTEAQWAKTGRHTEHAKPFGSETWLATYGEHLEVHSRQLERNILAWERK
jgi:DinB superfamily